MSDQVPPHNLDAERELLGSLLAYYTPEVLQGCRAAMDGEAFYWRPGGVKVHEIVWRAICAVADAGDHVDVLTVSRFLGRTRAASGSFLDLVGGEGTLHVLASHAVVAGVVERAVMIHEDGEWRRRLVKAQREVEACYVRDPVAYEAAGGDQPRLKLVS